MGELQPFRLKGLTFNPGGISMAHAPFQIPRDGAPVEEVLKSLGTQFSLDDAVIKGLLAAKIGHIEEFRFFFDAEEKITPWVQKLNLGEEHNIQCARLRRAWSAVRLFYTHAEQDRSKVSSTDLDSMLDEGELRNAKQTFWRRYKMRFPPELHPADATVSRVSRELDKRMLCVYNVWKVRTLQFQLHTTQKKRKLGDGLFTEEAEDESPTVQDAEAYLDRLYSLMLAYAIAGSAGVTGAPSLTEEGTLGSDSTQFVVAPLDVMMSYYFRAKRTAQQTPHSRRLVWLAARDAEERAEWVSRYRESTLTMGQVVKEIFAARDAHWITSAAAPPEVVAKAAVEPPATSGLGASHFQLGKMVNGKKVAKVMKDGLKLCAAFQQGQCKSNCPNGAHRCGVVIRGERTCGAPSHGASTCNQKVKS